VFRIRFCPSMNVELGCSRLGAAAIVFYLKELL